MAILTVPEDAKVSSAKLTGQYTGEALSQGIGS
jgi:hypothetical protein